MLADGCLCFLHLSGSGQEADDFSCCDACIMNQCAQWPTCEQQRCTLLSLGGALSSPLSRSTDSTQLRGRPASMGIHVAKSQSVSERRKPWLCSLPHKPTLHPKKELFIWAWDHGQPAVYKCVELAFFRELSCCFVLKDELPSHLQRTLNDIGCSCWLPGKDPWFSAKACAHEPSQYTTKSGRFQNDHGICQKLTRFCSVQRMRISFSC